MKKNGFTLAEVLITLTIIGVIAVLTLPALMTNTQEQQARTALRKMANTMTNIAAMSNAIDGFDYANITADSAVGDLGNDMATSPSLLNMIATRATINRDETVIGTGHPSIEGTLQVVFNDGTRVYIPAAIADTAGEMQADNIARGHICVFDTNGSRGPNQISNCVGADGVNGINTVAGDDEGNCATRTNRNFRDQYLMALRGTQVDPIGAASVFMMTEAVGAPSPAFQSGGNAGGIDGAN